MIRPALVTDSGCDLPASLLAEGDVDAVRFPYVIDRTERQPALGEGLGEFYRELRAGAMPTTSRIPLGDYARCFRRYAEVGTPVVFLAFSSALSGSIDSAHLARESVLEDFPDADIRIVDTRRASIAQGLLVCGAIEQRDAGATVDQLEAWARENSDRALGAFTIESLDHLVRGGRLPAAAAAAGTVLNVKPVLGFSADGGLTVDRLIRGRKKSLRFIADKPIGSPGRLVLVGHADAPDDAAAVEAMVLEGLPDVRVVRCEIGPVIGTHTGPGMVAVAWWN